MIPVSIFRDRTVAVMGMARSGRVAAEALAAGGARVLAWDENPQRRRAGPGRIEFADLSVADLHGVEALVLSPGIPHTHPSPHRVVSRARSNRIPVIGDIELLMRSCPARTTVAVSGTNGKSTTTALIGHVLRTAGHACDVGGNIGLPVLSFDAHHDLQVLELSSYQLELTPSLACQVAVLLNVSPDHLDRHGGFDGYVAAKERLLAAVSRDGTVVIGIQDPTCRRLRRMVERRSEPLVVPVSGRAVPIGGVGMQARRVVAEFRGRRRTIADLATARALPGAHNAQNACAAAAGAIALGVDERAIEAALLDFPGLAHRQEPVGTRNGVRFVNDSKATNADAAARALACYAAVYWIAGGLAKDDGLTALYPVLPRVRAAFFIGASMDAMASELEEQVPCHRCGTLDRAVEEAAGLARREGRDDAVVLLSPAAASFDQFESFEHRGDCFRDLVAGLGDVP